MSSLANKQVIDLVRKILSDLCKLGDDQIQNLLDGTAKFKYFDPNEVKPTEKKKIVKLKAAMDAPTMDAWKEHLFACQSKDEAIQYIESLPLTVANLKEFAKYLRCSLFGASKKAQIVTAIVNGTVMAKLNAEAIHRI